MYEPPKLERFGTLRELTKVGWFGTADGGGIFGAPGGGGNCENGGDHWTCDKRPNRS